MSARNTLAAKAERRATRKIRHVHGTEIRGWYVIDALIGVAQMRDPKKPLRTNRAQRRSRR